MGAPPGADLLPSFYSTRYDDGAGASPERATWCGTGLALSIGVSSSSYQDLDVWQRGMDLVVVIYELTRRLPRDEFDLRRQMRRAAVSIPANVAEGWNRRSRGAYRLHVGIALGSQAELETEMRVAVRTGSLSLDDREPALALIERVGRMLANLHARLAAPPA